MRHPYRLSLLVLACAAVLSSCGGGGGPDGESAATGGGQGTQQPIRPGADESPSETGSPAAPGTGGSEVVQAPTPDTPAPSGGGQAEQPSGGGQAEQPSPGTGSPAPSTPVPAPGTDAPPADEQPADAPASTPKVDRFGVTMVYPTRQGGGEEWYLAESATSDARFNPQEPITRNADGSWKMKSDQVRMGVYTSDGYRPASITTYDRDDLASKGYMQSPKDWKNVEMTGFVKLNAASDMSDNFAWYARGGRHTDDNGGCEGSAYKGDLYYDGRTRWAKETWHVSYEYTPYQSATSAVRGRWVGFKAVMYNVTVNGKPAVKMESYLNDNADKVTWRKVHERVDAGDFGGDASACGGSVDAMPITWGGPTATFRWDSATDVDFKWLSVREIQPPAP